MRWLFCIACLFPVLSLAQALDEPYPAPPKTGSTRSNTPNLDTLKNTVDKWTETGILHTDDSVKDFLHSVADTARYSQYKYRLDSISSCVNTQADSLRKCYAAVADRMYETQAKLTTRIDSLTRLSLPTDTLLHKLDSIQHQLVGLQNKLEDKIQSLQAKSFEEINAINFPPELKTEVSKAQASISRLTTENVLSKPPLRIPGMSVRDPGSNLPHLPGTPTDGLNVPGTGIENIPTLNQLSSTEIPIKSDITTYGLIPEEVTDVTGRITDVQQLGSIPIDEVAENKLSSLSQAQDIQQMAQIENADALMSEQALKAELTKRVQAAAVDHFAGKQEQLKAAISKLSKYKTQYTQAPAIAALKERPQNAMNKKPLAERLVPGINLQMQREGDHLLVDFNPYVGYRFTNRVTAGPGWNQRLGYSLDHYRFSPGTRIFGPRVFGEFKMGKGFSPRLEAEMMNTVVPPATIRIGDPHDRQWVPTVFAGLKKEYRFIGSVKGTASVMVRLFDPKRQSPYTDVVNARLGFEFPTKKKKNKSEKKE